jgi:hypothetical protein
MERHKKLWSRSTPIRDKRKTLRRRLTERCINLIIGTDLPLNMSQHDKLLLKILRGSSDANIPFEGLCHLLNHLGFVERIRGSHHIFTKDRVVEILNLQPKGAMAKPYQVKQVRQIIVKYKLGGKEDG